MARSKRIKLRRRYHLYTPGLLFVGATVLVLLGALNSENNLLYWLFGVAIGVVIVSGVLSGSSLMGLRIEGYAPESVTAGGTAMLRYRLRNTNRWMPAVALSLEDRTAGRKSDHRLFATGWVASLPAGATLDVTLPCRTQTRGRWKFTGLRASTTFPFGLTRKSVFAVQSRELVVRPRPAPVRSGELLGPLGGGFKTKRTNAHLGVRGEPYGLREYVPGDSVRSIAWRATARTGDLRVIEESLPTKALFKVAFRLAAGSPDSWADAAVELAAGVCMVAARAGVPVQIQGLDSTAATYERTLDALADMDPRQTPAEPVDAGTVVISDGSGSGRADVVLDVESWAQRRETGV